MTVDGMTKPRQLESYVAGQRVRGTGKGAMLLNAATGAPMARIDSSGVDFAAGLFVDPAPGPVLANYGVDNPWFLTRSIRATCSVYG